ncbi:alpha/beta hydrolase [Halosaccharopolyspora lacisalsi]|nr:alpha/beta hydrolase [Halosaccharopolyspora lacisalsi]
MYTWTDPALGVSPTDFEATGVDGETVGLRWFTKDGAVSEAAVVYLHGGGVIVGSIDDSAFRIAEYVRSTGVAVLAVEYRLAPEHPHPTPVEDCFAGLSWLVEHASELGADSARVAVMGESAGGGLAAGVALLARERGVALARQILVHPMLDDRTTAPDPELVPFGVWNYDMNFTGWNALLGDAVGTDAVPPSAAPARASELSGLAPAYIEVGELDIFRDEDMEYARRLAAAGVSVEFHVHPGCPHAFDGAAPDADVVARAMADRTRVLARL